MAAGLYGHDSVFTSTMDQAFETLGGLGDEIRRDWLADAPPPLFDDVTRAQPLLYAVNVALGRVVLDWGVEPVAMMGHSVGEFAAVTLAGVLTFDEGLELMRDRVRHYADTPPGGMLAVAASVEDVTPFLNGRVAVAAVNARQQVILAGADAELDGARRALRAAGFTCMATRARQAFHSPVVAEAARRTVDGWKSVRLMPPRRPVYSCHLEAPLDPEHALDPVFWASQPADTVRFWPTLELLLSSRDLILLEAGPGQGLTAIARRHSAVKRGRSAAVPLLPGPGAAPAAERDSVRAAAEQLLREGHPLRLPVPTRESS
jgi:acyl transferase domain-containing protein